MAFKDLSIYTCMYCGERLKTKSKYCKAQTMEDGTRLLGCSTQKGRKQVFDLNVEIIKENKAKGYSVPEGLRNWK
jgi:hypothetical protein